MVPEEANERRCRVAGVENVGRCTGVGVGVGVALIWVYRQAEAVVPAQHQRYVLTLSRLQALDARADSELLSARMGLVNNYDGLTQLFADMALQVEVLLALPDYLAQPARQPLLSLTRGVQTTQASKAELADTFKRHNAVLRNSLAYFPHAMQDFLQGTGQASVPVADRQLAERYGRAVMVYALSPSETYRQTVDAVAAELAGRAPALQTGTGLGHLALHGQQIVQRVAALEALHSQWGEVGSGRLLEQLSVAYAQANAAAEARAAVYRQGLYGLSLLLAVYLLGMFVVLKRARQSLAQANVETADRLAAQLAAEKQLKLHSTSFQHSHDGITLTDAQGNILDVNPAFSRITGWSRAEVLGETRACCDRGGTTRRFTKPCGTASSPTAPGPEKSGTATSLARCFPSCCPFPPFATLPVP